MNTIVLNIPHSVPMVDASKRSDPDAILREADKWTDHFTEQLFSAPDNDKVCTLVSPLSRYIVDMERLPLDPLEKVGQGIIYTKSKDGKSIRNVDNLERDRLLIEYGHYHGRLFQLTTKPGTLLIDCHSFPSDYSDVDVCIGFNDDATRPTDEMLETIKAHFELHKYNVKFNEPFSNSIVGTPDCTSVMIELNKRIYMNEATREMRPDGYKVHNLLNVLYDKLLAV